jgi:integrase
MKKIRRTRFPQFVQAFRDRHGKLRCYFRRAGFKTTPLPEPFFGDEFWAVYNQCLSGIEQPRPQSRPATGQVQAGSVAAAVRQFTTSKSFKTKFRASTQDRYRRTLVPLAKCNDPLSWATTEHLEEWIAEKGDLPGAAKDRLKAVRALFTFLVDTGRIKKRANPTIGLEAPDQRNEGARPWELDEVQIFRPVHALGTMARLWIELARNTGFRTSDLVQICPQHVRDGVVRLPRQQKTQRPVEIPILPELAEALAAMAPTSDLQPLLRTKKGRRFTAPNLRLYIRRWCDEAGLPKDLSNHGVRKEFGAEMADAGCSDEEIAAALGHASTAVTGVYTKGAKQRRLAQNAITKVSNRRKAGLTGSSQDIDQQRENRGLG